MQVNFQPIEKQDLESQGLKVHSIFYTIQGEGPFTGFPAVFVRLAGCNLQCPGCDTDYTSHRSHLQVSLIIEEIYKAFDGAETLPIVVITGGEPFRQNIAPFVAKLLTEHDFEVQIETNGTLYIPDMPWGHERLTIVCSPKAGKISALLAPHITAYKYVLDAESVDPEDGLPVLALDHTAKPRVARPHDQNTPIYLQPMDPQDPLLYSSNVKACIRSVMRYGYILQLQTHKIVGLE